MPPRRAPTRSARLAARDLDRAPAEQPDRRRERRVLDRVDEAADPGRAADPDRHLEDLAAELRRPRELRRAAGEDDPRRQHPVAAAGHLAASSSNVSRIRASMIRHSSSRLTVRPASSPSTETAISSSSRSRRSHVPCRTLSSSATWSVVLTPIATSLVTLLPPTGRTAVWNGEPSANSARSIVPGADVRDRDAQLLLGLGEHGLGRGERRRRRARRS